MIKCSVEDFLGRCVRSFYLNFRQFFIPAFPSQLLCFFKVPSGLFLFHSFLCPLHAHRRDTHLHQNLFTLLGAEGEAGISGLSIFLDEHILTLCKGFRKFGIEKDFLRLRPSFGMTPTTYAMIVYDFYVSIFGFIPASSILEVEHNCRLIRFWKSISMKSNSVRCGEFC